MRLKTSHGTYVVSGQGGALLHMPQPLDQDFPSVWTSTLQINPASGSMEVQITEGPLAHSTLVVLADGLFALRRDGRYLCAEPTSSELRFGPRQVGEWERFANEVTDGPVVRYERAEASDHQKRLSKPVLVETLAGYQIMGADCDSDIVAVSWPEFSSEPITRYSLPNGSWIVDVDSAPNSDRPYLVYLFYPFDFRIQVWELGRTGRRTFGYDLSKADARAFLISRQGLGAAFAARLYQLSQNDGGLENVVSNFTQLVAAAEGGSAEALHAILSHPLGFSLKTIRLLAARALQLLRATNRAQATQTEIHIQNALADALSKALRQLDPALGGLSAEKLQAEFDFREVFGGRMQRSDGADALAVTLHCHTINSLAILLDEFATHEAIGIVLHARRRTVEFHYAFSTGGIHNRVMDGIRHAYHAFSTAKAGFWDRAAAAEGAKKGRIIRFEVGDFPRATGRCVAFERALNDENVALVPDPYYFVFKGFRQGWFGAEVPPWRKKATKFVWRGSTTGAWDITKETMWQVPRVRLCEAGRAIGAVADFGITAVVQSRSEADAESIMRVLKEERMWRENMPQHIMGASKFLVEIDGNANSWGFIAKLLMGCCVLKVDSPFEQWFYQRLRPWVHYVPVAKDLSDLSNKVQWCLKHERACAKIADSGRRLAEAMTFDGEMAAAAEIFLSSAWTIE